MRLKERSVTGPLVCVIRGVVSAYYTADGKTTCAPVGYFRAFCALVQLRMETKSSVSIPALTIEFKHA